MSSTEPAAGTDFIRTRIIEDLKANKNNGRVATRFPPEPNGYLHIGHAKSINLNFGVAEEFSGTCNLRLDDTNPEKENTEYVESIKEDIRWLGYDWQGREFYASDYYGRLYEYAVQLIRKGKAFVCDLSPEEIREHRGTLKEPGRESPYRGRSIEENLELFERMRAGEFENGSRVLRAKIDMASPNIVMRDPVIYRIMKKSHYRTGDSWCIYPMYDFAHCISDSLEGITHSLCTLEFEINRDLYDWVLDELQTECHPQQIEFARLNLNYTILSKRRLLELVNGKYVSGWNDPRMPTISGLRRRGYTPPSIKDFCERISISKVNSTVDMSLLEFCIREDLNKKSPRAMAVLDPLKVVITNYPGDMVEEVEAENNPENPSMGKRRIPFSRVIYIERDDFMEIPPKKFFRLAPGKEVRLKHAYYITCQKAVRDEKTGEISELHCTYDPQSRGGGTPDGRKVKGTLHWVSATHAVNAEVRLYDRLFTREDPADIPDGEDWKVNLNPQSLITLRSCKIEPGLSEANPGDSFQFLRKGYFCVDLVDSRPMKPVFNRTVGLKDSWARIAQSSDE